VEYGGLDLAGADYDLDVTGIGVTRYDYNKEKHRFAWGAIQELLRSLNLQDEIKFFMDHSTTPPKYRLAVIAKAGVNDYTYTHVERVDSQLEVADLYSLMRIVHTYDQDPNLADPLYSHHPDYGAGAGLNPKKWIRCSADAKGWWLGTNTVLEAPAAQDDQFGNDMMVDGRLDTKNVAEFEEQDPGAPFPHSDWWFGSGAPLITLDEIEVWAGFYRAIEGWNRSTANENNTAVLKVMGANDYNPATFVGTFFDLGSRLEGIPEPDAQEPVKLLIDQFLDPVVNCIRIVWEFMPGRKADGDWYRAAIHQLRIQGNVTKYKYIQTTDNAANKTDPLFLYVPNTHKKLRGGIGASGGAGKQKCRERKIGAASDGAAITIGRAWLERSVKLWNTRSYLFTGTLNAKPELADTVGSDETGDGSSDYDGILQMIELEANNKGRRGVKYRVYDPEAADIA
jgi:hypothetical protein